LRSTTVIDHYYFYLICAVLLIYLPNFLSYEAEQWQWHY